LAVWSTSGLTVDELSVEVLVDELSAHVVFDELPVDIVVDELSSDVVVDGLSVDMVDELPVDATMPFGGGSVITVPPWPSLAKLKLAGV
jgi:hypothetical protein